MTVPGTRPAWEVWIPDNTKGRSEYRNRRVLGIFWHKPTDDELAKLKVENSLQHHKVAVTAISILLSEGKAYRVLHTAALKIYGELPPEKEKTIQELQQQIGRLQQALIHRVCGDPVKGLGLSINQFSYRTNHGPQEDSSDQASEAGN